MRAQSRTGKNRGIYLEAAQHHLKTIGHINLNVNDGETILNFVTDTLCRVSVIFCLEICFLYLVRRFHIVWKFRETNMRFHAKMGRN